MISDIQIYDILNLGSSINLINTSFSKSRGNSLHCFTMGSELAYDFFDMK